MELTYKVKVEIDNYSYDFEVITPLEKDEANLNDVIDDQILENLYNEISYAIRSDIEKRKSSDNAGR